MTLKFLLLTCSAIPRDTVEALAAEAETAEPAAALEAVVEAAEVAIEAAEERAEAAEAVAEHVTAAAIENVEQSAHNARFDELRREIEECRTHQQNAVGDALASIRSEFSERMTALESALATLTAVAVATVSTAEPSTPPASEAPPSEHLLAEAMAEPDAGADPAPVEKPKPKKRFL